MEEEKRTSIKQKEREKGEGLANSYPHKEIPA